MNDRQIEFDNRKKYNDGIIYRADNICCDPNKKGDLYIDELLKVKFSIIREYLPHNLPVLDLCCGSGLHLISLSNEISTGIGMDYSKPFIIKAQQDAEIHEHIHFLIGNARCLPMKDQSVGCVFSLSSLYTIPGTQDIIKEISRILMPGGKCIIELGNSHSLNMVVCKQYPEIAQPCFLKIQHMYDMIDQANLKILRHNAFQILPLWGDRPKWLYPLLHPFWNRIMKIKINGKMVDEIISNIPFIKRFAFRHIFVCVKK